MNDLVNNVNKLISQIAKGNRQSLDELYEITSRLLLLMARKYLYDKTYAEDLVSETYLIIVRKSGNFDKSKNGLNWLYKIVHNEAINHNLKNKNISNIEINESLHLRDDTNIDDLLDKILISDALNNLSERERLLIYQRYWKGLTIQEIANANKKPLITTYDELKRTLKKVGKALK